MSEANEKLARLVEAIDNEKDAKRQAMRGFNEEIKSLEKQARALAKSIRGE